MSLVKHTGFWFPDDMWNIIKTFAGINGNICCQCEGYYLHTSKNTQGFAMYDFNTCNYIWCCKKYYEQLYCQLYLNHSIWKYIFKEKQNYNFDYKFNYFIKNKKLILKYILLEKNNIDYFGRRKTLEKLILDDSNKNNKHKDNKKNKYKRIS